MKAKSNQIADKSEFEVFDEVLQMLYPMNDAEIQHTAEEAGVHWTTLYGWMAGKVYAPNLRTLYNVALALGFRITLVRSKKRLLKVIK